MSSFRSEAREPRDHDYWIENGRISFSIDDSIVSLDVSEWEEVVAAYSADGLSETKAEIAVRFDIPRPVLERMFKAAGIYKTSPPFTPERMEAAKSEEDIEDLVSASLELKTHRFQARLQRREIAELRKEVDELRARERNRSKLAEAFAEAASGLPPPAKLPPREKPRYRIRGGKVIGDAFRVHATSADIHAGLQVWDREAWSGRDYDLDIGAERIVEHGKKTAEWIASQAGRCEVCYLSDAGDIFHATTQHTTVSGKVSLQVDGRPRKIWEMVLRARKEAIEHIRRVCGVVEVRQVPGNHEGELAFFLQDALRWSYADAPDVRIFNTVNDQLGFVVGSTLHLVTHGSRIGVLSHKAKASFEVMARETAGDDYARVKSIKAYFGHLHSPAVSTQGRHMELIRLPAMAEVDDYAQSLYYIHEPEARLFRLGANGDIEIEKRVRF